MAKMSKERKQEVDDLKFVLAKPEGRRLMWRLIGLCGVFQYCTPDDESRRRFGVDLIGEIITESPGDYIRMQNEHMSEQTRKRIAKEKEKEETDESQE